MIDLKAEMRDAVNTGDELTNILASTEKVNWGKVVLLTAGVLAVVGGLYLLTKKSAAQSKVDKIRGKFCEELKQEADRLEKMFSDMDNSIPTIDEMSDNIKERAAEAKQRKLVKGVKELVVRMTEYNEEPYAASPVLTNKQGDAVPADEYVKTFSKLLLSAKADSVLAAGTFDKRAEDLSAEPSSRSESIYDFAAATVESIKDSKAPVVSTQYGDAPIGGIKYKSGTLVGALGDALNEHITICELGADIVKVASGVAKTTKKQSDRIEAEAKKAFGKKWRKVGGGPAGVYKAWDKECGVANKHGLVGLKLLQEDLVRYAAWHFNEIYMGMTHLENSVSLPAGDDGQFSGSEEIFNTFNDDVMIVQTRDMLKKMKAELKSVKDSFSSK